MTELIWLSVWISSGAILTGIAANLYTRRWGRPPHMALWMLALCGPGALGCVFSEISIRIFATDEEREIWKWSRERNQ